MELYKFAGISGQAIKSITQYLLRVSEVSVFCALKIYIE